MDTTPNQGGAFTGTGGSNKRRNRKKQGNRGASGHAGNGELPTVGHATPQSTGGQPPAPHSERPANQHYQSPIFAPSVQKLFDSVNNPVNLQITVTGQCRRVNEMAFYPAEPTPPTHASAPKHNQQKAAPSGASSYEAEGGPGQSWPSLEDSVMGNVKVPETGGRSEQKFPARKGGRRKGKKKGGVNQQLQLDPGDADAADGTERVNKQMESLTVDNKSSQPTDLSTGDVKPQLSAGSTKASPPFSQTSHEPTVQSAQQPVDQAKQKPTAQTKHKSEDHTSQKPEVQQNQKPKVQANQKPVGQANQKPVNQSTNDKKTHPAGKEVEASPTQDVVVQPDVLPAGESRGKRASGAQAEPPPPDDSSGEVADSMTQAADNKVEKLDSKEAVTDSKAQVAVSTATPTEKKPKPAQVNTFSNYIDAYRSKVGAKYIQELDSDYIRPLAKKSQKFPEAHFYCRLCEYHVDTPELMEEHRLNEDAHLRKKRIKSGDELLRNMPPPTKEHMKALSGYLDKVYKEVELSDEEVAAREAAVNKLEKDLHEHSSSLQCVTLQICGSVKAGFALKSSNTNIRIVTPKTANLAIVMTEISQVLSSLESTYKDVQSHFTTKEPSISFAIEGVSGTFCMQFLEESYYIANMLFSCYSKWHPKLKQLAVLFKYLAKVGGISDVSHGALAAYSFPILSIFFCQRSNLAPVLFENVDLESKTEAEFQGDIDVLPAIPKYFSDALESRSIAKLWLSLLGFYSLSSNFKQDIHCVTIVNRGLVMKAAKAWGSKRLAIEDPALPKRNLSKTVSHQRVFDFISDVIRKSYKYFSVPQLLSGPAFSKIYLPDIQHAAKQRKLSANDKGAVTADSTSRVVGPTEVSEPEDIIDSTVQASEGPSDEKSSLHSSTEEDDAAALVADDSNDDMAASTPVKPAADAATSAAATSAAATSSAIPKDEMLYDKERVEKLTADELLFDFSSEHLAIADTKLPIFCRQCSKPNHVTEDCPEEQLPVCIPLPPPSVEHRKLLSQLLYDIKEQTELCADHLKLRHKFVQELTRSIQRVYKKARLNLYGSSCNGFGSVGSDLDICMTLDGVDQLDCTKTQHIIKDVARGLSYIPHLQDILPLTHAKVPIVKFSSSQYELEADISLYNILAQRNTQMLYHYSQIDERVRPLGYCVKEFAKNCDIGDASKGSLSSYAYVLMLLYYLQQCDPPVLPVLQELYEGEKTPEVIVEGWNTWFYDKDKKQLAEDWTGYGKNERDIAQLWLGFLNFYSQEFDYKSTVISIRQQGRMSKFEKLWVSDTLAIEDPFDLKRNLGAALSKRMNAYILSTFIKARAVFGTSPEVLQHMPEEEKPTIYKFYFHHKDLPSGGGDQAPEHNRSCRACGQIGHYAKFCPVKAQRKDRQRQLRDMRQKAKAKAEHENREMERRMSENDGHAEPLRHDRPRNSPIKQQQYRGTANKHAPNHRPRQYNQQHMMHSPQNPAPNHNYMMNQNNNAQRHPAFPLMAQRFPPPPMAQHGVSPQSMVINNSHLPPQLFAGGQAYPTIPPATTPNMLSLQTSQFGSLGEETFSQILPTTVNLAP